jgi:phosphoglycolate phosphatase
MTRSFDVLAFDWDGTLIDSIGWIVQCLQYAARTCGEEEPGDAAARGVIGLSLTNAFGTLFPLSSPAERQALIAGYRELYFSHATRPEDLFPGVAEMLEQFRSRGYRLAVATGKATDGLRLALEGAGVASLFDATRCAEQTASKPDPLMLHEIMTDLGAAPERVLMVGDSVHDLQMAYNARVASAAVTCGANRSEQLLPLNPRWCLDFAPDLLDILD